MTSTPLRSPARARRQAFTLLEVLIASTLTLVIVALALEFAATMSLQARKVEQQGDLAARASIASSFLQSATDSIGYGWNVRQVVGTTSNDTDSFGLANCAVPAVCPATTTLPFQICDPATVGANVCAAQAAPTTSADALRFFLPRDGVIEAVRIVDRNGTTLPSNCTVATSTTFDVKGINATGWTAGDIVLVANFNHVSIFRVNSDFAAGTDPAATRQLTLNLGDPANIAGDDGGAGGSCDAAASLKGAGVYRLRLAALRLNQSTSTLEYGDVVTATGTLTFAPILADVDDFQVRLDLIRYVVASGSITTSSFCFSDTETVLSSAGGIASCDGMRLNSQASNGDVVRLVGLRVGLILRSRGGVDVNKPFTGLFDRTATIGTDRRLRRTITLFAGLPNALL
jgi:type II secretory pathway pseudopilin PulG